MYLVYQIQQLLNEPRKWTVSYGKERGSSILKDINNKSIIGVKDKTILALPYYSKKHTFQYYGET